jgi:hypothetical protein
MLPRVKSQVSSLKSHAPIQNSNVYWPTATSVEKEKKSYIHCAGSSSNRGKLQVAFLSKKKRKRKRKKGVNSQVLTCIQEHASAHVNPQMHCIN